MPRKRPNKVEDHTNQAKRWRNAAAKHRLRGLEMAKDAFALERDAIRYASTLATQGATPAMRKNIVSAGNRLARRRLDETTKELTEAGKARFHAGVHIGRAREIQGKLTPRITPRGRKRRMLDF